MGSTDIDIPTEILDKLQNFHQALEKMEEVLQPLITTNINSSDVKLPPLDKARLNLTCGYALNSLFWMYLNTLGIDPKEHGIKTELERYKSFMLQIKEITDKEKAPVLDKGAAGRFVRNALWEPKDNDAGSSSKRSVSPEVRVKEEDIDFSKRGVRKKKRKH